MNEDRGGPFLRNAASSDPSTKDSSVTLACSGGQPEMRAKVLRDFRPLSPCSAPEVYSSFLIGCPLLPAERHSAIAPIGRLLGSLCRSNGDSATE